MVLGGRIIRGRGLGLVFGPEVWLSVTLCKLHLSGLSLPVQTGRGLHCGFPRDWWLQSLGSWGRGVIGTQLLGQGGLGTSVVCSVGVETDTEDVGCLE